MIGDDGKRHDKALAATDAVDVGAEYDCAEGLMRKPAPKVMKVRSKRPTS